MATDEDTKVVKRIVLSPTKAITVSAWNRRGEVACDIRFFYRRKGQKNWLPTPKGIALPLSALLSVRNATRKVEQLAKPSPDKKPKKLK